MAYKGIYFQKEKEDSLVKESVSDFGIWCKDFPFKIHGDAKELAKTEWADNDGDDEFIPDIIRLKSYEISVDFAYKGVFKSANKKINDFLDYLTGRDGSGGSLKVFDAFAGIGRQNVRFVSVSPEGEYTRSESEGDIVLFKVTFKVNAPVTDITLTK